jgi:hypothetical protein
VCVVFRLSGRFQFGTAPDSDGEDVAKVAWPCTVGCLLDLDAGAMTVFVDGEPLEQQCEYKFPADREWAPSVGLAYEQDALFSDAA